MEINKLFNINTNYTDTTRKYYLKLVEYKCTKCEITKWNDKSITLDVDHINGIRSDNRLENLRLLCKNCHSQTDNFRGRGSNNGNKKISDEDLLKAYNETKSIRHALIQVNLTGSAGNYTRIKKLLEK